MFQLLSLYDGVKESCFAVYNRYTALGHGTCRISKKNPALYLRHEALLSRIILSISHLVLYGFIFLK